MSSFAIFIVFLILIILALVFVWVYYYNQGKIDENINPPPGLTCVTNNPSFTSTNVYTLSNSNATGTPLYFNWVGGGDIISFKMLPTATSATGLLYNADNSITLCTSTSGQCENQSLYLSINTTTNSLTTSTTVTTKWTTSGGVITGTNGSTTLVLSVGVRGPDYFAVARPQNGSIINCGWRITKIFPAS